MPTKSKFTLDVELELHAWRLADVFCKMDAEEQAVFFSCIKAITAFWDKPRAFQWQAMMEHLDDSTCALIQELAEYTRRD